MQPLLTYADIDEISYIAGDAGVVLSPAQQAMAVQAVSIFANSELWRDYDEYADEIDALVADTQEALLNSEIPPPVTTFPTIDLFALNATPLAGIGTLTYNANANLPFGYAISTQNITLYGMTMPVWFRAGDYDYIGWASLTTNGGNVSVAVTDAGGLVDTIIASVSQNGAFGTRVKHTGSFTIPEDGFYNLVVGDLGTAGGHVVNWISHHISQVS